MGPLAMPDPTRIWRVIVSVLLIVLVLATTMEWCVTIMTVFFGQLHAVPHDHRSPASAVGAIGLIRATAECAVRKMASFRNAG